MPGFRCAHSSATTSTTRSKRSASKKPVSVLQKNRGHDRRVTPVARSRQKLTAEYPASSNLDLSTYTLRKRNPFVATNVKSEATVLLRVDITLGCSFPAATTRWVVRFPPFMTSRVRSKFITAEGAK